MRQISVYLATAAITATVAVAGVLAVNPNSSLPGEAVRTSTPLDGIKMMKNAKDLPEQRHRRCDARIDPIDAVDRSQPCCFQKRKAPYPARGAQTTAPPRGVEDFLPQLRWTKHLLKQPGWAGLKLSDQAGPPNGSARNDLAPAPAGQGPLAGSALGRSRNGDGNSNRWVGSRGSAPRP
jgi:hypothetical protein